MRVFLAALFLATPAFAKDPDCGGRDRWPANSALSHLKNAGLVSTDQLDLNKTKVTRLASQKIGRDLYRQVHLVIFHRKDSVLVKAVTVNDASSEECSMSDVTVFPVMDLPKR